MEEEEGKREEGETHASKVQDELLARTSGTRVDVTWTSHDHCRPIRCMPTAGGSLRDTNTSEQEGLGHCPLFEGITSQRLATLNTLTAISSMREPSLGGSQWIVSSAPPQRE